MLRRLAGRVTRIVRRRRAGWSGASDRAFHDAVFAAQDHDPFDIGYPGNITIRRFADLASDLVSAGRMVCDVGCGPGEITCELARRHPGIEFRGYDHSTAAIRRAEIYANRLGLTNIAFAVADVERLVLPAGTDVATLFDSFHHLLHPRAFIGANDHVSRWLLIEPAGDGLGRWTFDFDFDWVLGDLEKIRGRLEHELTGRLFEPRGRVPAASVPPADQGGATEFRYSLEDYYSMFSAYGVQVTGTTSGLTAYPPVSGAASRLRRKAGDLGYELYAEIDRQLREAQLDLHARHWVLACTRGAEIPRRRRGPRPGWRAREGTGIRGPYDIEYEAVSGPSIAEPGGRLRLELTLSNHGHLTWSSATDPPIFASYHVLAADGRRVIQDGIRTPLARAVPPEGRVETVVIVDAPAAPGDYVVEIDLVHEGVSWFSEAGQRPIRHALTVA